MTDTVRAVVGHGSEEELRTLTGVLRSAGVEVVGEAADGNSVCALVRSRRPSVVVLATTIGGMDAFEATRRVMADVPTPIVIVSDDDDPEHVATSLRATEVGALTVQQGLPSAKSPDFAARADRLVTIVRAMADVKVVGRRRGAPPSRRTAEPATEGRPQRTARPKRRAVEVVAVGASTGGPPALHRFLGALPGGLAAPVMVVQHMAEGFVDGLVRWIRNATPLDVRVAADGEELRSGVVYVAPHGAHLEAAGDRTVLLSRRPPVSGFRPSVTVLLESVARIYGSGAAGVILTGMGEDGLAGAKALGDAGGVVMAQDEGSSVVFGMPRAVAGIAGHVGPPEVLALRIGELVPTNMR